MDFSDNGVELVRYDATGGERAVSLVYFLRSVFECVFTAYISGAERRPKMGWFHMVVCEPNKKLRAGTKLTGATFPMFFVWDTL